MVQKGALAYPYDFVIAEANPVKKVLEGMVKNLSKKIKA
jgi:hypothetical protein